jgi:hypothetical protein
MDCDILELIFSMLLCVIKESVWHKEREGLQGIDKASGLGGGKIPTRREKILSTHSTKSPRPPILANVDERSANGLGSSQIFLLKRE